MRGSRAYEAALKANNKRYTIYVYPNVNHAFNNDTSNRYDKPAADLAWSRTIAFFKEQLGAPPKAVSRQAPANFAGQPIRRAQQPRIVADGPDKLHADRHAALAFQQRQRHRRQPGQCPERVERRIAGGGAFRRHARAPTASGSRHSPSKCRPARRGNAARRRAPPDNAARCSGCLRQRDRAVACSTHRRRARPARRNCAPCRCT